MRTIAQILLMVVTIVISSASYAATISESAVFALIAQVDAAIKSRDANALGRLFSNNVDISGNISDRGASQPFRFNKTQYMAALKATWAQAQDYHYERSAVNVQLLGDKAIISATIIEKMHIAGHRINSKTRENVIVEWVNGKLQLTKITADSTIQ